MKLTIQVTQQDIVEGIPRDCALCPIALAAARVFTTKPAEEIWVVEDALFAVWDDTAHRFTLPDTARQFIKRYDDDRVRYDDAEAPIEPFTFTVDAKEHVAR